MPENHNAWSKSVVSAVLITCIFFFEDMFQGDPAPVTLTILFWASFTGIVLLPKTWWTRGRLCLAAGVMALETAAGLIWFQETRLLYFYALLLLILAFRWSNSGTSVRAVAILFVTALFYIRFGSNDLTSLLSFALLAAAVFMAVRSRMQRNRLYEENKRHLEELKEAYDELQEASAAAMRYAVLEERARIARDIHDAVGHSLTSLIVQMQALDYMIANDPHQARQALSGMLAVARQGLQDIRSSVHALAEDRSGSGIASFKALLSRMEASASIRHTFHSEVADDDLDSDQGGTLFRVLQEAVTNVIRHSGADLVEVGLRREDGHIVMRIRDNGTAAASGRKVEEGFGLKMMKARLEEQGGWLRYSHLEPHGFELAAALPAGEPQRPNGHGEE